LVRAVDAVGLIIGIVVGAGIFRTPSIVAQNAADVSTIYLAWMLGGVMSLIGALVYAELASTYPHAGGDYYYLTRAFGLRLSFLLGWSRMSVIQTGSITLVSFVFGDYASGLFSLGQYSSAVYAAIAVVTLSVLNILGVRHGTHTQNVMTVIQIVGVGTVILAGLVAGGSATVGEAAPTAGSSSFGLMMVFILLTYGGWNEAAYVSGELRDVHRNMARVLIFSILVITTLYLLMNWAYLHAMGRGGVAASQQVAADLMRLAFGEAGAKAISVIIGISALTTANATVFTGGRSSYALGRDFRQFAALGRWSSRTGTPVNALVLQCGISLLLVMMGVFTRRGFETIVEYTAPVFWFFFLLTGIAFFMLRWKDAAVSRPFRVPLYPVPPILFCTMCAYLLYSSLAYTGVGALAGVAVLGIGVMLLLFVHPSASTTKQT
jgi:amino acid transporter